jgi:hypothetical protein
MALSGPWAGMAEDLTEEAFTAESLSGRITKSIDQHCGDMSRREPGPCTRVACVALGGCAYVGAGDLT